MIRKKSPARKQGRHLDFIRTILIVDDQQMIRDVLGRTLSREGFVVVCATDGCDALEKLKDNEIDIIITSFKMPMMSGMELLEKVKSDHSHIPVIMITRHGDTTLQIQARNAGAIDIIIKPFNNLEIISSLQRTAHLMQLK